MPNFVETHNNFKTAIVGLIELKYEVLEAYSLAIEEISDERCIEKLNEFSLNHKRYMETILTFYASSTLKFPESGDVFKNTIVKLKFMFASLINSERDILQIILDIEKDINLSYEFILKSPNLSRDLYKTLNNAHIDEKKHKEWLQDYISSYTLSIH